MLAGEIGGHGRKGNTPSFRRGAAERRAAQASLGLRVRTEQSGQQEVGQSFSLQGAKGGIKDAGSAPPASSRRHRRVKGVWRSPRTRPCPLQFSA